MWGANLALGQWIWFPSERTLANTFMLFRRDLRLCGHPVGARGWIAADSRYRFRVNGHRVQWRPAPCEPRFLEADPVDLEAYLTSGANVHGVEVLFYGVGDGTWPAGKPGLVARIEVMDDTGDSQIIVTDASCRRMVDRAHGQGSR